jgi:hypothetical protein
MPQPSLGSSLQSFSLTRIACPSRGRQLPCSYPPVCRSALALAVHRRLPRRPRFHAVAWVPPTTMDSLWASSRAHFPVVLGSDQRNRLVPPASPASKLSSPRETVPATSSCPAATGRFSRVSAPSKLSPSTPRVLNPPASEDTNKTLVRRLGCSIRRTGSPLDRVRPSSSTSTQEDLVDSFQPLEDWPAPPLDGNPSLLALDSRAHPEALTFRASKYVESGVSPRRCLLP